MIDKDTISKALQYLARICDYAESQDGQGFNKFDAAFGHSLAEYTATGGTLTDRQATAALRMLLKYRGQLEQVGIKLTTAPDEQPVERVDPGVEPITPERSAPKSPTTSNATVWTENGRAYVKFPGKPDEAVRSAIKSIPGWKWHPERNDKAWSVPEASAVALAEAAAGKAPDSSPQYQPQPGTKLPAVILSRENGTILVQFPDPDGRSERVAKVKALPERKWNPDKPGLPWSVPNRYTLDLIAMFPEATVDEGVRELAEQQRELRAMSNKAQGSSLTEIDGLGGVPYPFQYVGVEFLDRANGRALIADQMGLGKTIQALAWLQLHPELRPAVIVVPASLKLNWQREIIRWMSKRDKVAILEGRKTFDPALTGADIFIINYDVLSPWVDTLVKMRPAVMIADEAHYAKNYKAQRTKALAKFAKAVERVILLTGTPVTNRPIELFPLLNMIDPEGWPSFFRYAKEYCGGYNDDYGFNVGGATNLEDLHQRIKPYVIRRTKDQVLKELPPKQRNTLVVRFDEAHRKEYNEMIYEAAMAAARTSAEALVFIEKAKQVTMRAKMADTLEWIKNFLEGGDKLVVFAVHHETVDAIMREFPGSAVRLTGRENLQERQEAVDAFQNDPRIQLFVGNIKAAGVGITLTAASDVAFVEFVWTPGDHDQAEDRTHRIGQTGSVTAWYIVAEGTIEETIVRLTESKRQVIDTIHDGKVGELEFSVAGELIKEIASEAKR